jgi:phenylalanyl-tRNA synthetase beta chain
MPTITVQRHDLHRLAHLPAETSLAELEERLSLVKGELNSRTEDGVRLRMPGGAWLEGAEDFKLRIELKDTNRPDLWSVEGIARQLRDHGRGHGEPYDFFTAEPAERRIEVDPALAALRPFIAGFLAYSATIDEDGLLAFIEAQEALTRNFGRKRKTVSLGLYAASDLRFPVQYKAVPLDGTRFEPLPPAAAPWGRPEQWPTGVAMTPAEILQKHPTGREYGEILAGWELAPLLTGAGGEVLSMPPIINSASLGRVTPGATALFVEATSVEQDQGLLAVNILATNLADRGWRIAPVTAHYPYDTPRGRTVTAPQPMPITQVAPVTAFSRLLGAELTPGEVVARLRAYGVEAAATGDEITATIPSYRQDYLHVVDMIEDYAISRGYDTLAPRMDQEFTVGHLQPMTEFEDLLRDLMIGFGFEEAICNLLTSIETLRERMNVPVTASAGAPPFHGGQTVHIENVMNREYAHLRDWLIPSLLEIEAQSAGAVYPHRIFEVGEVAVYDPAENMGSRTESRLAALIAGEDASFDAAQSVVYALMASYGLKFSITHWQHPSFIPGRVALVTIDHPQRGKMAAGFLGELAPQVLVNWGVRTPSAALELSVDELLGALA